MVTATLRETNAPNKRATVVAAAMALFIEQGYANASMEEVARRAGVAKQTVYNHFGSKHVLFQAIVDQICDELMSTVNFEASSITDPAAVLGDLARRFVRLMVTSTSIGLFRLLAAEAHRFPDLAETVFRAGPDRIVADLARYLDSQQKAGRLRIDDPELAAESFLGSLRGNLEMKALFSGARNLAVINADAERLDRYGEHCVATFMAAHGVDQSGQ